MNNPILLVEDDDSLIDGLCYALPKNGFSVDVARTVAEARSLLADSACYQLLILDVTLPDGSGFTVCEEIRQRGSVIPILFLTAADEEYHIIRGLDSGGDDYLTKPFRLGELCSRLRALLRRTDRTRTEQTAAQSTQLPQSTQSTTIERGDICIDLLASRVFLRGKGLDLTSAEYRLLCLLVRNANCIVTRERILQDLWDNAGNFVDDNTLSVYVRRLREKIEADPSHPRHLTTVRGFGYRWDEVSE